MIKVLIFFGIIFSYNTFFITNSYATENNINIDKLDNEKIENTSFLFKPIFLLDNTNVRNKKLFDLSLGIIYQYGSFNFTTPAAGSILSWSDTSNIGFNGAFTLNITDRLWARLDGDMSWLVAGTGTDDDITNKAGIFSKQKAIGYGGEVKAVLGYDILRFKKIDISFYGGIYSRGMRYSMGSGQFISANANIYPVGQYLITTEDQISTAQFIGGVFGTQFTHYGEGIITTLFAEGYVTEFSLEGNWVARNHLWNMSSKTFSYGFGIGGSTDIELGYNIWLKPSAKFQMLMLNEITNENGTQNPVYSYSGSGSGSVNFMMATVGLALSWK